MRNYLNKSLSFMMVLSMVYSPVLSQRALAGETSDDFKATCSQSLKDVEAKKSTEGDKKMGYCVDADMARQAKNVETVKSVIFLAGAAACTTFAILIATAHAEGVVSFGISEAQVPAYEAACMWTSVGASASGIAADITGKSIINSSKEKYGKAKDQVCSFSTFSPLVMQLTPMLISSGTSSSSESSNSGCIMCAIMLGISGGISVSQSVASKNLQKAAVKNAKEVAAASQAAVTSFSSAQLAAQAPSDSAPTSAAAAGSQDSASTDKCDKENGNAYLSCMGSISPEIAAISNSPEFLNQMKKSLHGKNLGDFVKGYDGESDIAAYVAGGLGVKTELVAGVMKNNEKMVKDTNFAEKYSPMGYTRTAAAKPKVSNDLDFSKLMSGMMGKMDPGGDAKEKRDPSELVFRQLELLPADKIEANKDISLFARIAFRYRKNVPNVEQLNWSRPENQLVPAQKK